MNKIDQELALAIQILDGFFCAEEGLTKQALVFDDAIRGLRYIQEFGYTPKYGEAYVKRRAKQASDVRSIPIVEELRTQIRR